DLGPRDLVRAYERPVGYRRDTARRWHSPGGCPGVEPRQQGAQQIRIAHLVGRLFSHAGSIDRIRRVRESGKKIGPYILGQGCITNPQRIGRDLRVLVEPVFIRRRDVEYLRTGVRLETVPENAVSSTAERIGLSTVCIWKRRVGIVERVMLHVRSPRGLRE